MHPLQSIGKDEKVLMEFKPDLFATFLPMVSVVFLFLIVLAFAYMTIPHGASSDNSSKVMPFLGFFSIARFFLFLAVIFFFGIVLAAIMLYLNYQYTFYIVTDRRIIMQRGVVSRDYRDCKFEKIQNIYIDVRFIDRIINVGALMFSTAGEQGIEIIFSRVKYPMEVKRQITEIIEARDAKDRSGV